MHKFCETKIWSCTIGAVIIAILFVTSIVFLIDHVMENESKLAHRLFGNRNSANLEVKIQPTSPIVGEQMYLHFTNHSENDGYWLAFNINREGTIEPYIPPNNKLGPDERQMYFQISAGKELIIPQPGVSEDPFFGLSPRQPTGKELLVVILVNEWHSELVNELLFAPEKKPSDVLQTLHDKLTKLLSEGESPSLQWSSVAIDYQTIPK